MPPAPATPPFATFIDILELAHRGPYEAAAGTVGSLLPAIRCFRDVTVERLTAVLDILDMIGPGVAVAPLARAVVTELQQGREVDALTVCCLAEGLTKHHELELEALAQEDARIRSEGGDGVEPSEAATVAEEFEMARELQFAMSMARQSYLSLRQTGHASAFHVRQR